MVRIVNDLPNGHGEPAEPELDPEEALRYHIFALLNESGTSGEQDLKVLRQCASHIQNKYLVEQIARACKMKLADFGCGKDIELYYNVKRGAQEIGYICKGWEDPGFRIGDVIEVPKDRAAQCKAATAQIRKLCAVNGLGVTIEKSGGARTISLDGVIYSEGFNKKTFKQTIETVIEVVQQIRQMID